jgi:glutathione S-transferase
MLTLYTYFRSSAAYRVRIGLALKGLAYKSVPVHLVRDGGEQHSAAFASLS